LSFIEFIRQRAGVNTPWRMRLRPDYARFVKQHQHFQAHPQKTAAAPGPTLAAALSAGEIDFTPAPDEVARRAYFTYVNQGSLDGHEVQHWLAAEQELIAERNLTRTHSFHNHQT